MLDHFIPVVLFMTTHTEGIIPLYDIAIHTIQLIITNRGRSYVNGRRDFYRPGSRIHYRNGRTAVNRDYNPNRRNTAVASRNTRTKSFYFVPKQLQVGVLQVGTLSLVFQETEKPYLLIERLLLGVLPLQEELRIIRLRFLEVTIAEALPKHLDLVFRVEVIHLPLNEALQNVLVAEKRLLQERAVLVTTEALQQEVAAIIKVKVLPLKIILKIQR